MIRAPFNFVPLANKVYFPDWAKNISMDIPFEDGLSGTIELKLTANSPIFVRNGHKKSDAPHDKTTGNDEYKSFSRTPDNHFFIPGTSIKGAIRSVLEVMSFCKMNFVQNQSFGLRDLNNNEYRNCIRGVHCGWLKLGNDSVILEDWGEPARISLDEIDKHYHTNLVNFVKKEINPKDDSDKTAKRKYAMLGDKALQMTKFSYDQKLTEAMRKKNKVDPRVFYQFGSSQEGIIVLTGQPSRREYNEKTKKNQGKYYEFVFLKPKSDITYTISEDLFKAFEFIHTTSPDYKDFWKEKLSKGEKIPVFFKLQDNTVHSIGLSFMYKYPYRNKVYNGIPEELSPDNECCDLAECIFGFTKEQAALKGRVVFGHAPCVGNPTPMQVKSFVSSSPHASFYPLYVENGNTWNQKLRINGRKRYVIRDVPYDNNTGTEGMKQYSCLLNKGVSFKEKIVFFNLRPVELGALLSAITFHGNNEECFQSIGFGKPLGYGKTKITLTALNIDGANGNPCSYMYEYEKCMQDVDPNWLNSPQLKELLLMAKGIKSNENKDFSYLKMSTNRRDNEFLQVKANHERLEKFSRLQRTDISIHSVKELECTLQVNAQSPAEKTIDDTFTATEYKVGDNVTAKCISNKKVIIDPHDYEIQLVVPKFSNSEELIGKSLNVIIKQISKNGKIAQVSLA